MSKGNLAQDTDFSIEKVILSQYASSPHIVAIAEAVWNSINPLEAIQCFYDNAYNPETATGVGLDWWGRIVGVNRLLTGVDAGDEYFGFIPVGDNDRITPFDNAPFYAPSLSSSYILEDSAYRLLIYTKAMANISTGTLPELNSMFYKMLGGVDVAVIHDDTMHLRIVIEDNDDFEDFQRTLLKRDDVGIIPCGVGWSLYEYDSDTFGFDGQGLETFDNGTFTLSTALTDCSDQDDDE